MLASSQSKHQASLQFEIERRQVFEGHAFQAALHFRNAVGCVNHTDALRRRLCALQIARTHAFKKRPGLTFETVRRFYAAGARPAGSLEGAGDCVPVGRAGCTMGNRRLVYKRTDALSHTGPPRFA